MTTAMLVRYTDQQCLGYDPQTDRDHWRFTAIFSDGVTRTWEVYLKINEYHEPPSFEAQPAE